MYKIVVEILTQPVVHCRHKRNTNMVTENKKKQEKPGINRKSSMTVAVFYFSFLSRIYIKEIRN